jgi:putative endonuclease
MHERFWVYIMSSTSGTLYVGMTNSLDRRVNAHKRHLIPGFTAKYNCTLLVYFEEISNPLNAIAREKQIKGWLRSKKIALIESMNPHWDDLAKNWGAQICPPNRSITELWTTGECWLKILVPHRRCYPRGGPSLRSG